MRSPTPECYRSRKLGSVLKIRHAQVVRGANADPDADWDMFETCILDCPHVMGQWCEVSGQRENKLIAFNSGSGPKSINVGLFRVPHTYNLAFFGSARLGKSRRSEVPPRVVLGLCRRLSIVALVHSQAAPEGTLKIGTAILLSKSPEAPHWLVFLRQWQVANFYSWDARSAHRY